MDGVDEGRVGSVHVEGRDVVPHVVPHDRVIVCRKHLSAQIADQRRDRPLGPARVQIAHGQIDHATVAPPSSGMDGDGVGQEPELGRDGIQTFPLVTAQHGEPELAPRRDSLGASVVFEELSGLDHGLVVGIELSIDQEVSIQRRPKDQSRSKNVVV